MTRRRAPGPGRGRSSKRAGCRSGRRCRRRGRPGRTVRREWHPRRIGPARPSARRPRAGHRARRSHLPGGPLVWSAAGPAPGRPPACRGHAAATTGAAASARARVRPVRAGRPARCRSARAASPSRRAPRGGRRAVAARQAPATRRRDARAAGGSPGGWNPPRCSSGRARRSAAPARAASPYRASRPAARRSPPVAPPVESAAARAQSRPRAPPPCGAGDRLPSTPSLPSCSRPGPAAYRSPCRRRGHATTLR
ncbi:hypothetical protein GO293_01438 [Ralstonia solanacearum]|nr:hypothetical protein [Ralstonia solanacearum]